MLELMTLHYNKVGSKRKGFRYDSTMLKVLVRDYGWLVEKMVVEITPQDLTKYRNERLKLVKSSTVRREFAYLSSVLGYAVTDLYIIDNNPCNLVKKPSDGKARRRRITDSEVDTLLEISGYQIGERPKTSTEYAMWSFLWALESAMRRNEILSMDWDNVHDRYVHLPTSKTNEARDVPVSPIMKKLLDSLPSKKGLLVPYPTEAIKTGFRRVLAKSEIQDLQFRDARHEAISRIVNRTKLPVEQLAKITGHRKIETLVNVYYNPTADELYNALYGDELKAT